MTKIGPRPLPPRAAPREDAERLSHRERKALSREYVQTCEQLRKARVELADLRSDYWGSQPRGEDVWNAMELSHTIRDLTAKVSELEGELQRHGMRNPKERTEWSVGVYASALLPGVASARAVVGIERSVDEMTGRAKIRPYSGPELECVAGDVGYMFGGDNSGALFTVATAPFVQVGKDPLLGTQVEVAIPGVGSLAVGSKGAVEVAPEIGLGVVGVGMKVAVKDPRLAKVTTPAAEKVEQGRAKVKEAIVSHLPHRRGPGGAPPDSAAEE